MTVVSASSPLRDLGLLVRPRLSVMTAFAALTGYLAAPTQAFFGPAIKVALGVFLLTASASIFNQVQERERDRQIPRTAVRPVACGRMQPSTALLIASSTTLAGFALLATLSWSAAVVGAAALVWYNLLYTPLKSRTSLVLLLGALGGALPPLLGWVASDSSPLDPRAIHLYLLLILWQVPHFCCLALRDGLHCQRVGLTVIPVHWSGDQVVRQVRLWSMATAVLLLTALPLALLHSYTGKILLCGLAAWGLGGIASRRPCPTSQHWGSSTGLRLNLLLASALILIAIDPLLT